MNDELGAQIVRKLRTKITWWALQRLEYSTGASVEDRETAALVSQLVSKTPAFSYLGWSYLPSL